MAKARKPTPKMLGTGAARRAADGLVARRGRLDAAIDGAPGKMTRTRGKVKKGK